MKPIKLAMTAFGPYSGEVVLDFREMEGRNFFLINGPTGSGKTTVLDAICFALYGVTSGAERLARQMRSHHSDENTLTRVVFDFSLGQDLYRVERTPEQMRPRKRGGDGLIAVKAEAAFWRRTGLSDDSEEGTVLATGVSHVTQAVADRMGCTEEQFRQVIILPQGQFRRFLLSGTAERQEILETLFRTEIYRRIEEALHEAAGHSVTSIKDLQGRRDMILGQAGAESAEQMAESKRAAGTRLAGMTDDMFRLRQGEASARESLRQAEQREVQFRERAEAVTALEALEKRKAGFDEKQKILEAGRRALPVAAAESGVIDRQKEAEAADRKTVLAQKVLDTARRDRQNALEAYRRAEESTADIDGIKAQLARLEDLAPLVEDFSRTRVNLEKAKAESKARLIDKTRAGENLDRIQKQLEAAQKTLQESVVLSNQVDRLEWDVRTLEKAHEDMRLLTALKTQHQSVSADCLTARNRIKGLEDDLAGIRQGIEDGEWLRHQAEAAALARDLEPGRPCPVCGATDHPAPARVEGSVPSEASLKKKRKQALDIETQIKTAAAAEMKLQTESARLQTRLDALNENLASYQDRTLQTLEKELTAKSKALAESKKADDLVKRLEKDIESLKDRVGQTEETRTRAEEDWRKAEEERSGIEAVFLDRQAKLPPDLGTMEALNQAKARETRRLQVLKKSLEEADRKARAAGEALAGAEAAFQAALAAGEEAGNRLDEQQQRYGQTLAQAGFSSQDDYQAAKMTESRIQELDREIKGFERDLAAAEQRRKRGEEAVAGLRRPDIPALKKAVQETSTKLEQAIGEQTTVREQIALLERQIEQVTLAEKEIETLEARYYLVGRLSEVALGKNPYKLTFQRFVLQTFLDEVLTAASTRLLVMSSGRYQLQRTTEVQDRRTAGGLDLQVFDAYTGQVRPVATLSGGESFLAALALALGLADVVQAHSGGIHLDTIFVDEGFGSLDPEALDLALRALVDLQKGGRLVGIISHVPELKERINTRLEVTASHNGSQARFVLG